MRKRSPRRSAAPPAYTNSAVICLLPVGPVSSGSLRKCTSRHYYRMCPGKTVVCYLQGRVRPAA